MQTQWQKNKASRGFQKSPHTPFWLERAVHEDDRAFCTGLPTCKEGTQKISVESLVREDEQENLEEMHTGWSLHQIHGSLFISLLTHPHINRSALSVSPALPFPFLQYVFPLKSALVTPCSQELPNTRTGGPPSGTARAAVSTWVLLSQRHPFCSWEIQGSSKCAFHVNIHTVLCLKRVSIL